MEEERHNLEISKVEFQQQQEEFEKRKEEQEATMANISQEKKDMQAWINTEVERRVKEAMEQQEEFEEQ